MPDDNSVIARALVSWDRIDFKPLRTLFPLAGSNRCVEFWIFAAPCAVNMLANRRIFCGD